MNFIASHNIYCLGRLITQKQYWILHKSLAEHDLLLIAAGKVAHDLPVAGGFDPHKLDHRAGNAILGNGKVQVTESNWHGNEKVTYDRVVDINSPSIYGAIRPGSIPKTA